MISANGGLPALRYTPQVTPRWPRGSEPASNLWQVQTLKMKKNKTEAGPRGLPRRLGAGPARLIGSAGKSENLSLDQNT